MADVIELVACMRMVCDSQTARNPVAWFELEQAGITRETMQELVSAGNWLGPQPVFEAAPERDSAFWQFLVKKYGESG